MVLRVREANEGWAAFVTALLNDRYDGTASALAKALDVSTSTVTRWIDGATPDIRRLKQLSRVESIPMLQLLAAAGALEDTEDATAGGSLAHSTPVQPGVDVDVITAIGRDPDLMDEAKTHLLNQYSLLLRIPPEPSVPAARKASRRTQTPSGDATELRAVARGGDPRDREEVRRLARRAREEHEKNQR